MKKNEPEKKNNIFFFPNLDKRLLEKGLDAIQQKKYKEAVPLLEEALTINPANSETKIGLVLAYFELGLLQKAKEIAKEMLADGSGEYIEVLDLYIMILVQLHEYQEIVTTIEVLLEDHQIPANRMEHFSKMLEFSRKMVLSDRIEVEIKEERDVQPLHLQSIQDPNEQMLLIANLSEQNIRSYIEEVKVFLQSQESNPFLKTMLLNILKEQEYNQEISIQKFDRIINVIPSELEDIQNQIQQADIIEILIDKVESNDPVLFENIRMLVDRQSFLLYPFPLENYSVDTWAAAYHSIVTEYFGQEESAIISSLYEIKLEDLQQAKQFISRLEEISYPNI